MIDWKVEQILLYKGRASPTLTPGISGGTGLAVWLKLNRLKLNKIQIYVSLLSGHGSHLILLVWVYLVSGVIQFLRD